MQGNHLGIQMPWHSKRSHHDAQHSLLQDHPQHANFTITIENLAPAHMHECDFVHGHTKPENALLTSNSIVKLTDFGTCASLSYEVAMQGSGSDRSGVSAVRWPGFKGNYLQCTLHCHIPSINFQLKIAHQKRRLAALLIGTELGKGVANMV